MELIGKIVQVLPLQEGVSKAGNPWKKQEYILETLGTQYPRKVCFNLFGDNVVNGRWYTDVRAWNVLNGVQLPGAPVAAPAPAPGFGAPVAPQPVAAAPAAPTVAPTAADDLPF